MHPGIWFPYRAGPYSASVDVYIYDDIDPLPPTTLGANQPWLDLMDSFDKDVKQGDGEYHLAFATHVMRDSRGNLFVTIRVFDKNGASTGPPLVTYRNAPYFSFNTWHSIRVDVLQNRRVILFQDNVPVCETLLPETPRLGTVGGHAGLYSGPRTNYTLLNDRFSFVIYPGSS